LTSGAKKAFYFGTDGGQNKLECLFPAVIKKKLFNIAILEKLLFILVPMSAEIS
jgi:hypothetical protein